MLQLIGSYYNSFVSCSNSSQEEQVPAVIIKQVSKSQKQRRRKINKLMLVALALRQSECLPG